MGVRGHDPAHDCSHGGVEKPHRQSLEQHLAGAIVGVKNNDDVIFSERDGLTESLGLTTPAGGSMEWTDVGVQTRVRL